MAQSGTKQSLIDNINVQASGFHRQQHPILGWAWQRRVFCQKVALSRPRKLTEVPEIRAF
jgi:hypothetical protein